MDIAPDTEVPRLLSFLFLAFGTVTDGEPAGRAHLARGDRRDTVGDDDETRQRSSP